jgi:hypothetical protein
MAILGFQGMHPLFPYTTLSIMNTSVTKKKKNNKNKNKTKKCIDFQIQKLSTQSKRHA